MIDRTNGCVITSYSIHYTKLYEIIEAASEIRCAMPIMVRMDGAKVEEGKRLLLDSKLNVQCVDSLGDGAAGIVKMIAQAPVC